MKGTAFNFFAFAAVCVLVGMLWGIHMAASGDHSMSGAHAHLNLVGWVTMGLFGVYYTLTPHAAATRLAGIHFWIAALGVVLLVPGIAMATTGGTEIVAILGSFVTLASMLVFVYTVFRNGLGARA